MSYNLHSKSNDSMKQNPEQLKAARMIVKRMPRAGTYVKPKLMVTKKFIVYIDRCHAKEE